ncbi:hypothetical protein [Elongatibacter sediminis]|uniref:Uncharacterized protein n=1 Tax=Elongatibacter sediminis TaxID=3119006 RepID=A0AAW9RES5_9GAMM
MSTVVRSTRRFSFFGVMGAVFAAVAVIGFAPNSVAILTGEKANPPLIIHLHAAAMSAWMALLAAQSWLMGAGKAAVHRNLGVAALVLAPVVFTLILAITVDQIRAGLGEPMVLLIQSKRLLGFGICVGLAYLWRTTRPAAHKRLMFLGTFAVLDAAFFRMGWLLPGLAHEHHVAVAHAWQLLLLVPFVVYDIRTLGRVHPVFLIGIPVLVAFDVMAAVVR